MNLTYRQLILLTTALTVFYDEVAKTSTTKMKEELQELSKIVQDAAMKAHKVLEKMNEDQRIKAIQTAIAGIDKYSDALKQLAETEKVELRAELEAKKKENFQLVADSCMKAYEEKYGSDVFPVDEHWVYMVAEYFGTGEGQTTCIMMTQATAGHKEDFDEEHKYIPITSKQYRAIRKFHERFGTWMLGGLRFLSKEDFFTECAYYIPPVMMKFSNAKCYKEFYTEVHYNFS